MGKEYKLVELTEEEIKNSGGNVIKFACSKCIANGCSEVCITLDGFFDICTDSPSSYFIEVETDDK